jgi:hypothetical protein
VCVTSNGDGFLPARHKTRDRVNDNGLTENSATEDVANGCTNLVKFRFV